MTKAKALHDALCGYGMPSHPLFRRGANRPMGKNDGLAALDAHALGWFLDELSRRYAACDWSYVRQSGHGLVHYIVQERSPDEPRAWGAGNSAAESIVNFFKNNCPNAQWFPVNYRPDIPAGMRFDCFQRDGFTCQYCGAKGTGVKLHCDHVIPVSKGGETALDNLTTACEQCNLGKSDKTIAESVARITKAKS